MLHLPAGKVEVLLEVEEEFLGDFWDVLGAC